MVFQICFIGQIREERALFDFVIFTESVDIHGCAVHEERGQNRGQGLVEGNFFRGKVLVISAVHGGEDVVIPVGG